MQPRPVASPPERASLGARRLVTVLFTDRPGLSLRPSEYWWGMGFGKALERFDRAQQRHAVLGFPLAVRRKYSDDQGGYLAATIAYYGFFSLFPLLLVLVTVLGYALAGNPSLQRRIVGSAFAQLPVIGTEIQQHALTGSPVALAIGIVGALWTGIGVLLASERAMSRIWDVPHDRELGFVTSRGRALGLLVVFGGGLLVTTALSGASAAGGSLGVAVRIGAGCISLGANFLLFWLAFRLLTPGSVPWACFVRGAAAAAVGYEALQVVGSYYVNHVVRNASNAYGTFALVIGLLSWIYLLATVFLFAAETNVIATRHLWPRPLRGESPTGGE